ncbi:hypothetical protein LguiB_021135 [Lonicera macranthoides]
MECIETLPYHFGYSLLAVGMTITLARSHGFSRQTKYLQGSHGARARLLGRGIELMELRV